MPELKQFQVPNFAANFLQMEKLRDTGQAATATATNKAAESLRNFGIEQGKLGVSQGQLGLDAIKQAAEQKKITRKNSIEANDFALNLLTGVNSAEDLEIAKGQFKARYPEQGQIVDHLLPTYNPTGVRIVKNSLRTETQRLKLEEQKEEQAQKLNEAKIAGRKQSLAETEAKKPTGFDVFVSPEGNSVYIPKGGEIPAGFSKYEKASTPAKVEFDVFVGPKGQQQFIKRGKPIPPGFKKLQAKTGPAININTGDLSKSTTTQLQKDVVKGIQSIKSFQETRKRFKPEYLTLFGKGENIIAEQMDRLGITNEEQDQLIADRQDWFRRAKADFIAYRKWATGVAGGPQELKEIATSFPDPVKNGPAKYLANLDSIEDTTKDILRLNADFLNLGINMDQPLDKIISEAKKGGLDIETPPLGAQEVTITFTRDASGKIVRGSK